MSDVAVFWLALIAFVLGVVALWWRRQREEARRRTPWYVKAAHHGVELLRLRQHYSELSDEELLGAYALGAGGYRDEAIWEVVETEVLSRESTRETAQGRQRALEPLARVPPPLTCQQCGRLGPVSTFPFGLAAGVESDWGGTGLTAAASVAASLLTGAAGFWIESPAGRARILRLELQLCPECALKKHGGVLLNRDDYAKHPHWEGAIAAGFTKFLDPSELKNWKRLK